VKSPIAPRGPGKGIFDNFIQCVRSRKAEELDAHILEGHYSSALCHLANISYRLGEDVPFDRQVRAFAGNTAATEAFAQMKEHLKDNGVSLTDTKYRVGRFLKFDAVRERFIDDDEANKLLTREYRAPFVVPNEV